MNVIKKAFELASQRGHSNVAEILHQRYRAVSEEQQER
jgi:hypothetical protein